MTVYNGGSYLAEAVSSVLAQSFRDFELLVVDDASDDESAAVLRRFAEADTRVRVLTSATNLGPPSASNMGLAQARGSLLARLDADDVCLPGRLQRQVDMFDSDPALVLLGSAFDYVDGAGRWVAEGRYPLEDAALRTFLIEAGCPFCHSAVMMRVDAVRRLGGYRQVVNRYSLDYDLFLRLAEMGTIANLPDKLVGYRVHPGQITAQKMELQVRSAHVYRILAQQRRQGNAEDLPRALAEVEASPGRLRDALVAGYIHWAEMMDRFDASQARQLRLRAARMAPWHPRVLRMFLSRARRAITGRPRA